MLPKFFRKYLPSAESIRENRFIGRFSALQHPNLWHLNRHAVAGGVAAGLFTGLIPGSNPVQFTAAALAAVIFRVNLPVAVFVTFYTNPFTIVPLYFLAYKLGAFFIGQNNGNLPQHELNLWDLPLTDWISALIHWAAAMGKPLALGLILLALLFAAMGYVAVQLAWRAYIMLQWRKRKMRRSTAH
ncbi:MAG TPA: DUF2062 domain-containing protein [Burkholderiales bacterium]|nr:DUF2062 domain-containing protein [Burkholderiales bacterium]